ncbi:50S ribosomal protein L19 [bacterium]|nr:50S ribosomal protein L19 [bacterium]
MKLPENKMPDVRPGDIVRVHVKIKEGEKERQQVFEGVVIKKSGGKGPSASILVRKISQGIGVERKFKIFSPFLAKIEVKKRSSVKRADLTYLRNIKQVHRHLKDKKIEPFEQMLYVEPKKEVVEDVVAEAPAEEVKTEKAPEDKKEEKKEESKE